MQRTVCQAQKLLAGSDSDIVGAYRFQVIDQLAGRRTVQQVQRVDATALGQNRRQVEIEPPFEIAWIAFS